MKLNTRHVAVLDHRLKKVIPARCDKSLMNKQHTIDQLEAS
jgi:hypothetical protein